MTGRYFSRHLFWKECRQMQGFWLGVLGLIVVLQIVVTIVMVTTGEAKHLAEGLLGVAVMLPVLYALGSGAALFAMEHETGTYDFLRALPTCPAASLVNKLAFAAVSTPLLVVAGGLSAAIPAWLLGGGDIRLLEAMLLWACIAVYLFAWAAFFSLLVRQVTKAAVLAIFVALFSLLFSVGLLREMGGLTEHLAIAVSGPTIFLTVAVLDVWLGLRWFREAGTWKLVPQRSVSDEESAIESTFALERMPSKRVPFLHLLWHQWRQSRGMVWTFSIVLFPVIWVLAGPLFARWNWMHWFLASWAPLALFAGILIIPLAGTGVFAGGPEAAAVSIFDGAGSLAASGVVEPAVGLAGGDGGLGADRRRVFSVLLASIGSAPGHGLGQARSFRGVSVGGRPLCAGGLLFSANFVR